jgi:hypothetical protein
MKGSCSWLGSNLEVLLYPIWTEAYEAFLDIGRRCIIDKATFGWAPIYSDLSIGKVHDGRVDLNFEVCVRRLSSFSSMLSRPRRSRVMNAKAALDVSWAVLRFTLHF